MSGLMALLYPTWYSELHARALSPGEMAILESRDTDKYRAVVEH